MAVVKRTQVINKPVDVVFQTVVDVANFPNWNPTIPSARKLSNGEIGNGTRFELEIRGSDQKPGLVRMISARIARGGVHSTTALIQPPYGRLSGLRARPRRVRRTLPW
jgi:hypothetical protein